MSETVIMHSTCSPRCTAHNLMGALQPRHKQLSAKLSVRLAMNRVHGGLQRPDPVFEPPAGQPLRARPRGHPCRGGLCSLPCSPVGDAGVLQSSCSVAHFNFCRQCPQHIHSAHQPYIGARAVVPFSLMCWPTSWCPYCALLLMDFTEMQEMPPPLNTCRLQLGVVGSCTCHLHANSASILTYVMLSLASFQVDTLPVLLSRIG
jgi:hypothetical protein